MTRVNTINPQNSWFKSENYDNSIETQIKKNSKVQFSINWMLQDRVEKKIN